MDTQSKGSGSGCPAHPCNLTTGQVIPSPAFTSTPVELWREEGAICGWNSPARSSSTSSANHVGDYATSRMFAPSVGHWPFTSSLCSQVLRTTRRGCTSTAAGRSLGANDERENLSFLLTSIKHYCSCNLEWITDLYYPCLEMSSKNNITLNTLV